MMILPAESKPEEQQMVWEAVPSWAQFSWLYLLSAVSALRGLVLLRFGVSGWDMWILGAVILLVCAVILRQWAQYDLTRDRITVRNGYTGGEMQSIPLSDVELVTVEQGVIANFFGIGMVLVHKRGSDRVLSLRGVCDPEEVKIRIKAAAWRQNWAASHHRDNS